MRNSYARIIALLFLLLPGSLAAAQQEQPKVPVQPTYTVKYDIRYMDLHAAEVLAWDQCAQKEKCQISASTLNGVANVRGQLTIYTDSATHEKIARALARADASPRTQNFQFLLLAASTQGGSAGLEVPANAQKALTDLKGFLPFKSYELLDSAWVRATQGDGIQARLVGRQGAQYELELRFRNTGTQEDRSLFVDGFVLKAEPFQPPALANGEKPAPRPGRRLIDTSFGLKEGETIVVGTSKIDGGDEALVLLLTAVPVG
ncbi:MAG TPA: hypothetical protein VIW92_03435 [Thermoanaerobaculia bacterium]